MVRTRAVCLGLLALSGLAMAQQAHLAEQPQPGSVRHALAAAPAPAPVTEAPARPGSDPSRNLTPEMQAVLEHLVAARNAVGGDLRPRGAGQPGVLAPRQPLPKLPDAGLQVPPGASGRLIIKFKDDWKVRVAPDGRLISASNRDVTALTALAAASGLRFEPAIRKPAARIASIEVRAAANSGRAQPDLAGLVYLDGPGGVPPAVALQLNRFAQDQALDPVEFVEYEPRYVVKSSAGPQTGACCLPTGDCVELTSDECTQGMGVWWGGAPCGPSGICGGCCIDNACAIDSIPQPLCEEQIGGIFLGGAACGDKDDPCELVPGACCLPNQNCIQVVLDQCDAVGGEWNGPTTTCGGQPCGACCFGIDECEVDQVSGPVCDAMGGGFLPGQSCDDDPDPCVPACSNPNMGDCWFPSPFPFCNDLCGGFPCTQQEPGCCEFVCTIDPFCCDDQNWPGTVPREGYPGFPGRGGSCLGPACWDAWCADHALELCVPPFVFQVTPPDPPVIDPGQPTPTFVAAQGYLSSLGYVQEYGGVPPEVAYALQYEATGNFLDGYSGEGLDLQALWELGDFLAGNLGTENLTRGRTIRVGVIESTAFVETARGPDGPYMHEDLHGKVIPEPDQTPLIIPGTDNDGNHGTATLGIIGAIDHDAAGNPVPLGLSPDESRAEEMGMVGVAPEAELWFFPTFTVEEGSRLINAMASAIDTFGAGDVLNFSIGPSGCGTLASGAASWIMLRTAADLGITCCLSAGNDCCDLSELAAPQAFGDCGATIVGACFPGCDNADFFQAFPFWATTPGFNCYCRLDFSNFCTGCTGLDAIHVAAWGESVATLGYGDLFPIPALGQTIPNRSYTSTFGGTSSAAPMIAGLAAALQGMAKMFWGIPLMPEQVRTALSSSVYDQCGIASVEVLPGRHPEIVADCNLDASGDWDLDEDASNIGPPSGSFPDAFSAGLAIIKNGWFDGNALIDDFHVLRGTLLYGNLISLTASDNNYMIIESEYTNAGGGSPLNPLDPPYISSGEITDLVVEAHVTTSELDTMTVVAETHVSGGTGLAFIEVYNWVLQRYQFVAFNVLTGLDDPYGTTGLLASQFVRPSDELVMIRIWTLSIGGNGNGGGIGGHGAARYRVFHDLVGLGEGDDFGDVIPP